MRGLVSTPVFAHVGPSLCQAAHAVASRHEPRTLVHPRAGVLPRCLATAGQSPCPATAGSACSQLPLASPHARPPAPLQFRQTLENVVRSGGASPKLAALVKTLRDHFEARDTVTSLPTGSQACQQPSSGP